MDAEQRSVFQGIVYYYRENMVNCRYQVTLKDAMDGALLQQALDAARAKAPYYFQKPVWEKKLLHLEPSDAPCPVRQGSAKPEFPDENGFTVALSYEGKVVYFDWFHFLADGRGMAPFMTMVLQFYCNLRYGTAFEGRTLETDPAYDIEDILAKYPESQVANDMQRPVVQTFEETPTCCRVRLEKAGLWTPPSAAASSPSVPSRPCSVRRCRRIWIRTRCSTATRQTPATRWVRRTPSTTAWHPSSASCR